jgi:hydrogenase/urease accessory protein HupE
VRGSSLVAALAVLVLVAPMPVSAHPLAPSVLSFEQADDGVVSMSWRAPIKRPTGQSLRPRVPEACEPLGAPAIEQTEDGLAVVETLKLRCEPADMIGAVIAVDGLDASSINVVVRFVGADGEAQHAILDTGRPQLTIAPPEQSTHSFFEYLMLGVEHLVTGWDHMTFVIGLLILFGWRRRLIAAVTAFTLGHSLTLALSVLGIVSVPQAWVEALIALTIMILALEIQTNEKGPVWRHPWTLPAALGLLHGLGFASVLFDAGLPASEIPLALLGFNLGLEVGQLGVIALAGASYAALRSAVPDPWRENRRVPAYLIGSLAAYWMIDRVFSAFGVVV